MAIHWKLVLHGLAMSVRLVRGYRYLDRCGELLIRIGDKLDEGWIPGDVNPQSGSLANYRLGMSAKINAETMAVNQSEFVSFDHFRTESCRLFEVTRTCLELSRIRAPSVQFSYQIGCDSQEESTEVINRLGLWDVDAGLLSVLGGTLAARTSVHCTENMIEWAGEGVKQRKRVEISGKVQERQPPFDARVLMRTPLLSLRDQQVVRDLLKVRRSHPLLTPVAAQFDFETSLEDEFSARTFDMNQYMIEANSWVSACHAFVSSRIKEVARK